MSANAAAMACLGPAAGDSKETIRVVGSERTMRRAASARPAQAVATKILRAERTIELEMERNGGKYPHNGGALDEQELCRRAGVSSLALKGITHSTGTRIQPAPWLRRVAD